MTEPRTITPQEAQEVLRDDEKKHYLYDWQRTYVHTVATEPERTRAAVVKALRGFAHSWDGADDPAEYEDVTVELLEFAKAIEGGSDY